MSPLHLAAFVFTLLMVSNLSRAQSGPRLKDIAPKGFAIGGLLQGDMYKRSFYDLGYRAIADREFNAIVVTYFIGWAAWDWEKDIPIYEGFPEIVDWAFNRGKRVQGHVLLFPGAVRHRWGETPDWLVRDRVERSIDAFAGIRTGKIWTWIAANEVIGDDFDLMDGLGLRTHWSGDSNQPVREYHAFGGNSYYVEQAFHRAKARDPNAKLILNDYGVDVIKPKSNRLYNYAKYLVEKTDTPIHGVGFQMHLGYGYIPRVKDIRENMQRFLKLGLNVYVTELDVKSRESPNPGPNHTAPNSKELLMQKRAFQNVLKACLSIRGCESVILWDFGDKHSWLHPDGSGDYLYPAPFENGDGNSAKPAYYGMQSVLMGHL